MPFDRRDALQRLGEALRPLTWCFSRVYVNDERTRVIVAGVIWEKDSVPPPRFFTILANRGLITMSMSPDGWYAICATPRYIELLDEGTWA